MRSGADIGVRWATQAGSELFWLWVQVHARQVHEHLCESVTIIGAQSLEAAVRQRQRDGGVIGEGAEEAFDLFF